MPEYAILALGLWVLPWPFIATAETLTPIGRVLFAVLWPLALAMLAVVAALTVILDWLDRVIFGAEEGR